MSTYEAGRTGRLPIIQSSTAVTAAILLAACAGVGGVNSPGGSAPTTTTPTPVPPATPTPTPTLQRPGILGGHRRIQGVRCRRVREAHRGVTRSFGTPICDFERMMGALSQYALRAGEKLRSHGLVAARLTTFFHTNKHKPDRPQYGGSRMVTLHPMTNDSFDLIAAARRGAEKAWRHGYAYT